MAERIAGKLGIKKVEHADELLLHLFKEQETISLPKSADVSGGIPENKWGILANDSLGDCGPAATGHLDMAKAAIKTVKGITEYEKGFKPPTTKFIEDLYFAYGISQGEPGPKPDQGVSNLTWLTYLYQQKQIEAFAEVDVTSPGAADRAHQAMIQFNGCLTGVSLNKDCFGQFERNEPWSISATDPIDPSMGHDIALVAYGKKPVGAPANYKVNKRVQDWFVSWGNYQAATVAWDSAAITDCWVILTKEDAARAGYDFAAAVKAIEKMINAHGIVS